ncbi:hypothetical protein FNT36_10655 [Hymenobacter setariae]|uniref:DUF481 domain-containing protein n=1 Tax=Hymenobacter setariae TaxID=2594794 RepID=A0A558BZI0_9BACT|nr:hypothetical protein FNT36_10655 [Hymenobacter setariae]
MRNLFLPVAFAGSMLALAQPAYAQYNPNEASRFVQPLELWPELQGEIALHNGDYVLLALRGERSTSPYSYGRRSLGFDTRRVSAAYEHFWNERWSWGGTLRYESGANLETNSYYSKLLVPEVLLRHRSPIFGGLTFGQRLSVERQVVVGRQPLGFSAPDGQFWGRLRVDVERLFPLGTTAAGLALRPRLSYTASTHLRFQKSATDRDERTIQFTSLRGEVGVRLSPVIDFTPWFAYQTVYQQSLVFTDSNGNPVSGGKGNYVYPTLGLDFRFTLLPTGGKADRQQLPTQH